MSAIKPPTRLGIRRAPQKIAKDGEWSTFDDVMLLPQIQSPHCDGKRVRIGVGRSSVVAWEGDAKLVDLPFTDIRSVGKSTDFETVWLTTRSNKQYFLNSPHWKKIRYTLAYYLYKAADQK